MAKYRVLVGEHIVMDKDKSIVYGPGKEAGDVFESSEDMLKHNGGGMSPKFALVEETAAEAAQRGFDTLHTDRDKYPPVVDKLVTPSVPIAEKK